MNLQNRSIYCKDNIDVMRGIDSGCVDLVYLDPPFNKKKVFTAPIGSSSEGASFTDIFREEDVKDEWLQLIKEDYYAVHDLLIAVRSIEGRTSYNFCYLAYMAIRLLEIHRILKDTGSVYLHCDPTMSHYLKLLLDCVFGEDNFRNEIIWCYTGPGKTTHSFKRKHDVILFYTKSDKAGFSTIHIPHKRQSVSTGASSYASGKRTLAEAQQAEAESIKRGKPIEDWWSDIGAGSHMPKGERTGYPTQKPLTLLERIIAASSKEGDVVLDPFCGCATACVAAERLGRQWVGVDVSVKAYELVQERLGREVEWEGSLFEESLVSFSTDPPKRSDGTDSVAPQKYVYIISNAQYAGEYKVGIASDTKKRLSSYNTADPNRAYKLEYEFLTPHFRAIEAFIHEKYDNRHEWVRGDMEAIKKDIESWQPE